MSDFKEYADLILNEMKRQDQSHRDTLEELSKIKDKQVEHSEVLLRNTLSLEEHMRRTEVLEELHDVNAKRINMHDKKIIELEKPQIAVKFIFKWIVGLGAFSGAIITIAKFMGLF
jgi:hypothetical protein